MSWHFFFSFLKSMVRVMSCALLWSHDISGAAVGFVLAEILGVFEELK